MRSKKKQANVPLVVVAGGAGFVGSHLSESLLNSGVKVIGLDDLATGSMANIASFRRHPNYEFIECNLNQVIPDSLTRRPITHVVHAMGIDTHSQSKNATLASLLAGSFGTKNLLDLAVKKGARFLLASTVNVYDGLASSTSLHNYFGSTEEQKAQYSLYEAKRYAEGLCQMYADEYNLDVRVARLSTVYGPRMDLCDSTFLDTMIHQTLEGQDLVVEEEGSQEIYLTYVDDAVYGMSKLLFAEGEQFHQSIYPLVSPEKTSIISLAYTLRTYLPPGRDVKFLSQTKPNHFDLPVLSLDRVRRDLDWEPETSLTEGIKKTIESFKKGSSQHIRRHAVGREIFATHPVSKEDSEKPAEELELKPAASVNLHTEEVKNLVGTPVDDVVPLLGDMPPDTSRLPFRGGTAKKPTSQQEAEKELDAALDALASESKNKKDVTGAKKGNKLRGPAARLKPQHWWQRLLFAVVIIGLYASVGRPIIHTTTYAVAGGIDLYRATSAVKSLQLDKSEQRFESSQQMFAKAKQSIEPLKWSAGILGLQNSQQELEKGLAALSASSDGLATLSSAAAPWPEHLQKLLQFNSEEIEPIDIEGLSKQSKAELAQSREQFGQALALLSGSDTSMVASATMSAKDGESVGTRGLFAGLLQQAREMLSQAQLYLSQAEQVLGVLPSVLGSDEGKNYLLMFQNSNELRPTGGFMGSYALVQVEEGRIVDFKIDDIYNPDGQLNSQIKAPEPYANKLNVKYISLRDANWSPDVPTSAKSVASFYEEATKVPIDGVVFVTINAIRPLLEALGPIHLADYNETVTSENFDMLAQTHSNVGYVAGSTKKRDFLGVLAEAVLARIEQGNPNDILSAGKAISQSLDQKEIQMYFDDPSVALLVNQYDWAGITKAATDDYLRVIDANLAINKSNYYVTRSTNYSINVDRNSHLKGVVTINWSHSGKSGTWPGGDYVNYVRVYVPEGARLTDSINFDNNRVDSFKEGDKQVYGGYVTVPYDSQKTVTLKYNLPQRLGVLENNGNYELLWQKQSGIDEEPMTVTFNTPPFLKAGGVSGNGKLNDDNVSWEYGGLTDRSFQVDLEHR